MRLLADENVSGLVVTILREAGFDVARLADDERGSRDEAVLALAETEQRVVITEDRDFGELVVRKRLPVAGVVLLELDQLSKHAEAARVLSVVSSLATQIEGKLVVVEPSRTRIRPLPGPRP